MSERALIAALRKAANPRRASVARGPGSRGTAVRLGIGDDCAILRPRRSDELVVTTDLFLEQVHFRRDWHPPEAAGHRCLARGLSDIAAMGARPVAAFLSFALPPELAGAWARRFVAGLLALARQHGVVLAGGDTAQAPVNTSRAIFTADIVVIGAVRRQQALLRSGARIGDAIYVTGALGGAAAELALLQQAPRRFASLVRARAGHPHLYPEPRLAAGTALLSRASAAIDLSDGLSTDLAHLCEESGVAAEVEAALLPIHPLVPAQAPEEENALSLALHGGEDYELLFTAPPSQRFRSTIAGTTVRRIGTILASKRGRPRVTIVSPTGKRAPLRNLGWEHLRSSV